MSAAGTSTISTSSSSVAACTAVPPPTTAQAGLKPVCSKSTWSRAMRRAQRRRCPAAGARSGGIPLAVASIEMWHSMRHMLGDDGEFRATGQVRVARTRPSSSNARSAPPRSGRLATTTRWSSTARSCAAWCRSWRALRRGPLYARDGYAFPFKATTAFRLKAEELGAVVKEGPRSKRSSVRESVAVRTDHGQFRAPVLVNAAGAWGAEIARMVGDDPVEEPVALMMMVSAACRISSTPRWAAWAASCRSSRCAPARW